jgi:hypothetical protein
VLSIDDLRWIESLSLAPKEDHQLRLLAHGLRTLQTIASRHQGESPSRATIESWVLGQPQIAEDPGFARAFGALLDRLAKNRSVTPLSLELDDLLIWIEAHRSPIPNLAEPEPDCDHRVRISAP